MECKKYVKEHTGDKWTLSEIKELTMEKLWTWDKKDGIKNDGYAYLEVDKCIDFEKEVWFKLGQSMWNKHQSVFQNHVKYIHNDTVKPF